MRIAAITAPFVVGMLIFSCQRKEPAPLVPAAGTVKAVDRAVDDLSTARCDYAQRCDDIGPDATYSDRDHCIKATRDEARTELNACRRGMDEDDLRECLTQIENEDCNGVFSELDQYKNCTLDDLCAD